jgi:hypothetical protein
VAAKLNGDLAVVSMLPQEALHAQGPSPLFIDWNNLNGLAIARKKRYRAIYP